MLAHITGWAICMFVWHLHGDDGFHSAGAGARLHDGQHSVQAGLVVPERQAHLQNYDSV